MKPLKIIKDEIISILEENQDILFKEAENSLTPFSAKENICQLKSLLMEIGQEFIANYFEGYDSTEKVLENNGLPLRFKYKHGKEFATSLGKIRINRNVYQADRGGKSFAPLDEMIGVGSDYVSPDLKEPLLYASSNNTPNEVAKLFCMLGVIDIHESTLRDICRKTGEEVQAHYDEILSNVREAEPVPCSNVIVASMDGVNLLTREPGGKKGRPKERPGNEGQGKASAYKNATCGSLTYYNVIENKGKLEHERLRSVYHANMPEHKSITLKKHLEDEIASLGDMPVTRIMLCDGHRAIWNYVDNTPLYKGFLQLVDYFHAAEHLSLLAEHLFGKSSKKAGDWYRKTSDILKNREKGVEKVIRSANYYLSKGKAGGKARAEAEKEIQYFKNNKKKMNYGFFVESGYPIGSGVIEAACKSIVKQRMCRSGQRWSNEGGQPVLDLRAIVKSNRWPLFWKEYSNIHYVKVA